MRIEREYSGVAPRALWEAMTDLDFLSARSTRFGGRSEPDVDRSGGQVVVTTPRQIPMDDVPGPLRRYVGTGALVQTDVWTDVAADQVSGTWTTDPGGMPASLTGTHAIVATPSGCRYVVTATVKVHVPLIGGRLAGEVRKHVEELVRNELEFLAEWLDSQA
jgi:hypothetical protein